MRELYSGDPCHLSCGLGDIKNYYLRFLEMSPKERLKNRGSDLT